MSIGNFFLRSLKDVNEPIHPFTSVNEAAYWLLSKGLGANYATVRTSIYACLSGKINSMYGYVATKSITVPLVCSMPAIKSIVVETVYKLWIQIDDNYILISDVAIDTLNGMPDEEFDKHVTGFDRLDGVNYYKTYELPWIVDLITSLIRDLNLKAGCKGKAVDPE